MSFQTSPHHDFTIILDASFCTSNIHAGMGAIYRSSSGQWVKESCGSFVSSDANMAELIALYETLRWIKDHKRSSCLVLSNSLVVVDNVNGQTKIPGHYNYYTTMCTELLQEESKLQIQKIERSQVQEADILAKKVRRGSRVDNVFHQFCTNPWVKRNIALDDLNYEHIMLCCNDGGITPVVAIANC